MLGCIGSIGKDWQGVESSRTQFAPSWEVEIACSARQSLPDLSDFPLKLKLRLTLRDLGDYSPGLNESFE